MSVLLAQVAGILVARLAWSLLAPGFGAAVLMRENHRGAPVPTAAGVVLPIVVLVFTAVRPVAARAGLGQPEPLGPDTVALVVVAAGLGLLGLFDDLAGSGAERGFRGHLRGLAGGRLTTGGLKLVGGTAVALIAAAAAHPEPGLSRLVVDAGLIALGANLANLFDRAPGRVTKAGAFGFLALAAGTGAAGALAGTAVVVGAALALLPDDLGERLMLGDAGANVLGGALALGVVVTCSPLTRVVVLVVLAALNLAGEVVSFSRVIDAVGPLRAVDRAGRRDP